MKIHPTAHFGQNYDKLSPIFQRKTNKALKLLLNNLRHSSLKAKKYDEERNIWQARVDKNFRFYFLIEKDTYILLDIKCHK